MDEVMRLVGIIYVVGMLIITVILTVGGYILQRDRYWIRVWEEIGKPEVKSIKELKVYINEKSHPIVHFKLNQDGIDSEKR
jgi:hypothetical protein